MRAEREGWAGFQEADTELVLIGAEGGDAASPP